MAKKQVGVSLRKPPPPADPDAFVASGREPAHAVGRESAVRAVAPEAHDLARASQGAGAEITVSTDSGRALREITVYLPVDLARRLSVACAEKDRDISNLVAEAVTLHMTEKPAPLPEAPAWNGRRIPMSVPWREWRRAVVSILRARARSWAH